MSIEDPPFVATQIDHHRRRIVRAPRASSRRTATSLPLQDATRRPRNWWSLSGELVSHPDRRLAGDDQDRAGPPASVGETVRSAAARSTGSADSIVARTLVSSRLTSAVLEICRWSRGSARPPDGAGSVRSRCMHCCRVGVAVEAELGGQSNHRGRPHIGRPGQLGDGAETDCLRRRQDRFGDPALGRRQRATVASDALGHLHRRPPYPVAIRDASATLEAMCIASCN